MKITQVEPQKKNPKRFNIYLDGQFAFGADEDTIVAERLIVGKDIPPENLEKLLFEVEVGKLVEKVYGQLNVRLRSEKEIRDFLKRLSFKRKIKDQEEISEIALESLIEKLKTKDLINDERFTREWIEARSKKKGINAIKMELYQKGIDREIIEAGLRGQGEGDRKTAADLLNKKARIWRNLPQDEFKYKATRFLVGRGFDYSLAKEVVENTYQKEV